MINTIKDKDFFITLMSYRLLRLLLGIFTTCFLLPTNKALALNPHLFTLTTQLTISPRECQSRANQAAKLVLTKVDKSNVKNEYYQLIGRTSTASTTIYCIIGKSNTMLIVATSVNYSQYKQEAQSINNKITDVIQGKI